MEAVNDNANIYGNLIASPVRPTAPFLDYMSYKPAVPIL